MTAIAALSPTAPGRQELSCTAVVATAARTARRQLDVYRKVPGAQRGSDWSPSQNGPAAPACRFPGAGGGAEPCVGTGGQ